MYFFRSEKSEGVEEWRHYSANAEKRGGYRSERSEGVRGVETLPRFRSERSEGVRGVETKKSAAILTDSSTRFQEKLHSID